MFCIITVRTTETGETIAGPYSCLQCLPLYWKNVEVRQRLSRCIMSSVGSSSSTVEFSTAFSVQSRVS